MRRLSSYFIGCSGAVVALATFLVGLEVSAISTASPSLSHTAPMVNRTLKSDRLPVVLSKSRNAGPAGPGSEAQIARRVRAHGQRDRTFAAGADCRALRLLSALDI